ncbi:ABC transporter ATP-binding protein [Ferruginivarius sediminum]|uniref:ATP-binding cassette domain-containing protein n=1 Tax=Ferruginivarius sediminum TaxID=2661937 RepID=A0A369TGZ7_9PROT|nr:ABC transporter ATP-binding protein [Ferruginivarius sediminum]RDD63407.1 ATP-binding cassette domain-containing protein [Ferruginivarius sediminum]
MIELDNLDLTLSSQAGPVHILRGLSLTIDAGETVSVVGPSGSGKSSMMMVVGGLERPSGGRVTVAGHNLGGMSEDALATFRRDNVGIVFQDFHLIPTMTALENVAIPLEFAGRRDAFERAAECLRQVGLGERLSHYPGQLSGGEQQRTALARAFAAEPKLLLADEPTGNLDGATGQHVMQLLFDLCRQDGTTLVLITHDEDIAARCARRVQLVDGRILDDGHATRAAAEHAAGAR